MYSFFYYILGALNLIAFFAYGLDKLKAKANKRRTPEKTLFLLALPFSAPGALLGMILFNHKTSKAKFRYGVPILLILQLAIAYYSGFAGLR